MEIEIGTKLAIVLVLITLLYASSQVAKEGARRRK